MSFNEFLLWIGNSGGSVIIVSWALERMKWYQEFASDKKQWVFFIACAITSVLAYIILTFVPKEILNAIAPFFSILYVTFGSVFLGQTFHKIDKLNKAG